MSGKVNSKGQWLRTAAADDKWIRRVLEETNLGFLFPQWWNWSADRREHLSVWLDQYMQEHGDARWQGGERPEVPMELRSYHLSMREYEERLREWTSLFYGGPISVEGIQRQLGQSLAGAHVGDSDETPQGVIWWLQMENMTSVMLTRMGTHYDGSGETLSPEEKQFFDNMIRSVTNSKTAAVDEMGLDYIMNWLSGHGWDVSFDGHGGGSARAPYTPDYITVDIDESGRWLLHAQRGIDRALGNRYNLDDPNVDIQKILQSLPQMQLSQEQQDVLSRLHGTGRKDIQAPDVASWDADQLAQAQVWLDAHEGGGSEGVESPSARPSEDLVGEGQLDLDLIYEFKGAETTIPDETLAELVSTRGAFERAVRRAANAWLTRARASNMLPPSVASEIVQYISDDSGMFDAWLSSVGHGTGIWDRLPDLLVEHVDRNRAWAIASSFANAVGHDREVERLGDELDNSLRPAEVEPDTYVEDESSGEPVLREDADEDEEDEDDDDDRTAMKKDAATDEEVINALTAIGESYSYDEIATWPDDFRDQLIVWADALQEGKGRHTELGPEQFVPITVQNAEMLIYDLLEHETSEGVPSTPSDEEWNEIQHLLSDFMLQAESALTRWAFRSGLPHVVLDELADTMVGWQDAGFFVYTAAGGSDSMVTWLGEDLQMHGGGGGLNGANHWEELYDLDITEQTVGRAMFEVLREDPQVQKAFRALQTRLVEVANTHVYEDEEESLHADFEWPYEGAVYIVQPPGIEAERPNGGLVQINEGRALIVHRLVRDGASPYIEVLIRGSYPPGSGRFFIAPHEWEGSVELEVPEEEEVVEDAPLEDEGPQPDDYVISWTQRGWNVGRIESRRGLGVFSTMGEAARAIEAEMEREGYFPAVWQDHGGSRGEPTLLNTQELAQQDLPEPEVDEDPWGLEDDEDDENEREASVVVRSADFRQPHNYFKTPRPSFMPPVDELDNNQDGESYVRDNLGGEGDEGRIITESTEPIDDTMNEWDAGTSNLAYESPHGFSEQNWTASKSARVGLNNRLHAYKACALTTELRAVTAQQYTIGPHARKRMQAANPPLSDIEVLRVAQNGEVIEDYPEDPRGPSQLKIGVGEGGRPIHTVVSRNGFVITTYVPSQEQWSTDYKKRADMGQSLRDLSTDRLLDPTPLESESDEMLLGTDAEKKTAALSEEESQVLWDRAQELFDGGKVVRSGSNLWKTIFESADGQRQIRITIAGRQKDPTDASSPGGLPIVAWMMINSWKNTGQPHWLDKTKPGFDPDDGPDAWISLDGEKTSLQSALQMIEQWAVDMRAFLGEISSPREASVTVKVGEDENEEDEDPEEATSGSEEDASSLSLTAGEWHEDQAQDFIVFADWLTDLMAASGWQEGFTWEGHKAWFNDDYVAELRPPDEGWGPHIGAMSFAIYRLNQIERVPGQELPRVSFTHPARIDVSLDPNEGLDLNTMRQQIQEVVRDHSSGRTAKTAQERPNLRNMPVYYQVRMYGETWTEDDVEAGEAGDQWTEVDDTMSLEDLMRLVDSHGPWEDGGRWWTSYGESEFPSGQRTNYSLHVEAEDDGDLTEEQHDVLSQLITNYDIRRSMANEIEVHSNGNVDADTSYDVAMQDGDEYLTFVRGILQQYGFQKIDLHPFAGGRPGVVDGEEWLLDGRVSVALLFLDPEQIQTIVSIDGNPPKVTDDFTLEYYNAFGDEGIDQAKGDFMASLRKALRAATGGGNKEDQTVIWDILTEAFGDFEPRKNFQGWWRKQVFNEPGKQHARSTRGVDIDLRGANTRYNEIPKVQFIEATFYTDDQNGLGQREVHHLVGDNIDASISWVQSLIQEINKFLAER